MWFLVSLALIQARAGEISHFCEMLLAPHATTEDFLTTSLFKQYGEQLSLARVSSNQDYADQLRRVTGELVAQHTITPAQAETVFAERLLGRFAPIFLQYTLAELVDRGFGTTEITLFLKNFNRAYLPRRQVEFAIAVARRMTLTVNDDPSISSAQGVVQFAAAARAFGVDEESYSQFLSAWTFVRESQAETIVQYILLNILNAGRMFEEQVQDRLERATATPPLEVSRWSRFLWGPTRSTEVAVTFESLSGEMIDTKNIPRHLIEVRGLQKADKRPSFLDRFFNRAQDLSQDLRSYLIDLETVPPMARALVLTNDFESMNYHLLRNLTSHSQFQALDKKSREQGFKTLAAFDQLNAKVERMLRLRLEARIANPSATAGSSTVSPVRNEKIVAEFLARFEKLLPRSLSPSDGGEAATSAAFNQTYTELRGIYPDQFSSEDFLAIANGTATRVLSTRYFSPGRGLINGLRGMSQDFTLTDDQANTLIRFLSNFDVNTYKDNKVKGHMKINGDGELNDILKSSGWGKRGITKPKILNYFAQSPELVTLMNEIQALLSAQNEDHVNPIDLMELLARLKNERP